MPLRLALTVDSLRLSVGPGGGGTLPSPPATEILLATEFGDLLVLDDGTPIAVEDHHGG